MIKKFLSSTLLKFTSVVFLGNLGAQIMTFVAFAVFARYFDKEAIGVYFIFISLCTLFALPATGRYEMAIVLPKDQESAKGLWFLSLILAFIFALIVFIVLSLVPFGLYFEKAEKLQWLIYLVPIGIANMAAFVSSVQMMNRLKGFKHLAVIKVVQIILLFSFSMYIAQNYTYSASTLVLGWVAAFSLTNIALIVIVLRLLSKFKAKKIVDLAVDFKRYPTVALAGNFMNTLSIELPNYFLPVFFGTSVETLYGYANRVVAIPRNLISASFGDVFYTSATELSLKSKRELLKYLDKAIGWLFLTSVAIYLFSILVSDFLFPLVFGPEYIEAVPYFKYLALAAIFLFVQSPISYITDILNKLNHSLIYTTVSLIVKASTLFIGVKLFENPIHVIGLFSIVSALLSLFWIVYLRYLTNLSQLEHKGISDNDHI